MTINLGAQSDGFTITGSAHADTITGVAGADVINAGAGADTIVGFTTGDTVDGGSATDTLTLAATSAGAERGGRMPTWSMSRSSRRRWRQPG